jgi:hypothetical protein
MWIDDLALYGGSDRIVAIGWLERGHDYPVGEVPSDVYSKLAALLVDPWQIAVAAGPHPCDLCMYSPEKRGTNNVFVPGNGRVYVAPELILHYMNAHRYRPPDEFCRSVMACPQMRSSEYRRALMSAAGPGFLRAVGDS